MIGTVAVKIVALYVHEDNFKDSVTIVMLQMLKMVHTVSSLLLTLEPLTVDMLYRGKQIRIQ